MGQRLAGLSQEYLARQLTHFRDGHRGETFDDTYGRQMSLIAGGLTDGNIETMTEFLATIPARAAAEQGDLPGDVDRGEKLYSANCASGHGTDAKGIAALSASRLAGQQNVYLARQIRLFNDGLRGIHSVDIYGQQMRSSAVLLTTEQAINDVSAYLGSLTKYQNQFVATDNASVVIDFYQRLGAGDKSVIYDVLDPEVVP